MRSPGVGVGSERVPNLVVSCVSVNDINAWNQCSNYFCFQPFEVSIPYFPQSMTSKPHYYYLQSQSWVRDWVQSLDLSIPTSSPQQQQ